MRLEQTAQEHDDAIQGIRSCLKLASMLNDRLSKLGESLNFIGGNHIEEAQTAIICAAHARTVEAMLQKIFTAEHISAQKLL